MRHRWINAVLQLEYRDKFRSKQRTIESQPRLNLSANNSGKAFIPVDGRKRIVSFRSRINGMQKPPEKVDLSNTDPMAFVPGMDDAEFRRRGKEMIDYIADYLSNIK